MHEQHLQFTIQNTKVLSSKLQYTSAECPLLFVVVTIQTVEF